MKKKQLLVIGCFIIAIILSSIYPLKNHYKDKSIINIPFHHTYEDALKSLKDSIIKCAKEKKCKKYILPVEKIRGDKSLYIYPSLKEDINLALATYKEWELRASSPEIDDMKKRFDKTSKLWGEFVGFDNIINIVQSQGDVEINTRYSAQAELIKLNNENKDDQKLILKINNNRKQSLVFKVEVSFVNPNTLKKWEKNQSEQKAYIKKLEKKADLSWHFVKIFSLLLALYIIYLIIHYFFIRNKEKQNLEYFLIEIEKRQELADNGHFVAALQLVNKYLKYFPDDTDVVAFKERLLDFTNNDPKKAQIAYVEAKKLQMRIKLAQDDPMKAFLSADEKQRLTPYLPYNPKLKESYIALVSHEEKANKELELQSKLKIIKNLLSQAKLLKAEKLTNELKYNNNNDDLDKIINEIEDKKEKAKQNWKKLKNYLINGDFNNAKIILDDILLFFKDMPDAVRLQKDIVEAKGKTHFVLKSKNQDKKIEIFCGNKFTIGREDENNTPDIMFDDRRVSRNHASFIFKNNEIFIQDLNSAGGTYINGKKISRLSLKNNDTLNLAKIVNLNVSLFYTKNQNVGGVVLSGKSVDIVIIFSAIQFDIKNDKFYSKSDKYKFYYNNDMVLFAEKNNACFLIPEQEINLNNNKYLVEVKK